jgi:hypothetical protein
MSAFSSGAKTFRRPALNGGLIEPLSAAGRASGPAGSALDNFFIHLCSVAVSAALQTMDYEGQSTVDSLYQYLLYIFAVCLRML